MKINLKISPRSSKNSVIKQPDGTLKVYLTAAPVDNEANESLIKILSEYLAVGKSKIKIVRGRTSRTKVVEIVI